MSTPTPGSDIGFAGGMAADSLLTENRASKMNFLGVKEFFFHDF